MRTPYSFNPEEAFNTIKDHWTKWGEQVNAKRWVVGISGGKDSTVVAALANKIFPGKVLGVLMPNGEQADIKDSYAVCEAANILSVTVNIGKAFSGLLDEVKNVATNYFHMKEPSDDTVVNMPARLRMTALYAVAQNLPNTFVVNTSNRSENVVSFATLYGDHAGSYAPIQNLTVTEVMQLGDWLGLPHHLVHKTPIDGLQPKSDEEKLGVIYAEIDRLIRLGEGTDEVKEKVWGYYNRGKFKLDMVRMSGPAFENLPDIFREQGGL